jgi:hypothetical protein
MTSWSRLVAEQPELMAAVEARLRATKHHVLATLRRDGSPRVSGNEVDLWGGDLCLGMMDGSRKARDLQRDGRVAIHSNPGEPTMEGGDAKLAGVATEITDAAELSAFIGERHPPEPFHLFRVDLTEVVWTHLNEAGDLLVIESWHPGRGREVVSRA